MVRGKSEKNQRYGTSSKIRDLKSEIERVAGPFEMGFSRKCDDALRQSFLEYVLAYEQTRPVPVLEALTSAGMKVLPPEQIPDGELPGELLKVIRGMSLLGAYIHNTDHLSDRDLYSLLWSEILREPTVLMPDNACFSAHVDLVGTGKKEDADTYLRYYADEKARRKWARDFPDWVIPAHEPLPYDRDRHLPQPPPPPAPGSPVLITTGVGLKPPRSAGVQRCSEQKPN